MARIQDVAQLAQVSTATASRALSRPEVVAPATRDRVLSAAEELGYQPNVLARSLRQRETRTIGLIVADILNPFHALLAKGVQDAADRAGYTVMLFNSDEEPDKERRALDTLSGHLPQGLIIEPTRGTRQHLRRLPGLTVVEVDRVSGDPAATSVTVDNRGGARAATEHLTRLGHTRIGMIVGQLDISTAIERREGFAQALTDAGLRLDPALLLCGQHREDDGYRAARALLSRAAAERPTALFVGNNEMTVGALNAARELGLRLPHDLSLVGFDDSRLAQTMTPALTVVAQPAYDLGRLACEHLIGRLRGGAHRAAPPARVQLPTELLIRESTGPPPAGPAPGAARPPSSPSSP